MEGTTRFILELILVCACVCLDWGQSCPSHRQTSAKLTVNSQRNQTGQWISQVRIDHGAGNNTVTTTPWTAEVEHNTASCSGVESVQLVVTLTGWHSLCSCDAPKGGGLPVCAVFFPNKRFLFTTPPPRAGPGYELHRGVGYYKVHSERNTWHEARRICAEEGGHLAIINSEEESKVLQSIFAPVAARLNVVWAFIGFHDLYREGQYLTVFDEPLTSTGFYRWSDPNQPDNYGGNATLPGEDCGSMRTNGGLNDLPCTAKVPFICEQELW